ncbi:ERAD-associated E3 ubiquitin-protein ligase hrd1-like isoform X1 [Zootermopsis nevadensis]|uniref:RING finger protein 145 n=1 Tax=Zootermopsis nevadensis TaxID=136037 RepID=A0A067QLC0_ZOONE|nr:ERAD-associated E3 ubiquitin-protein ligase hrd1-like isoform X1 [Zootermopsis nevadensis]XP_021937011.1 ERAD-associated E3 ubiquitin-protein ligase hrd1-like isoform X1 [Zootermopsis nevadensis]XP_021937012.1 ERAD-associated E3 ubiquitin-protein ligase hrd1-like isoform X1 [Zootermopsis nevadensis]KDR10081.1 RING finger protein 145 [Zootermopsis nevadensis]
MVGNPYRYRAALHELENRNATAGCLLAPLFLIPLAGRLYSMVTLLSLALVYVALVVPMATGFYSAGSLFARMRSIAAHMWDIDILHYSARRTWALMTCLHNLYMRLDTIHTTTNQVLFFLLAEKILCPDQRLACLYCLLFYTVLAYLQRSLYTRHWSRLLNENSAADFIKLTTAFIIVRLGKGMAMSMVLLTFTLQFNHLELTYSYVALTLLYFLLSQYKGAAGEETFIVSAVRHLELQVLEGFEEFWVPLAIYGSTVALSVTLTLAAVWQFNYWTLCIIVGYANVYVCGLQVLDRYWGPLAAQRAVIAPFPLATLQQITERGDSTCPVCLDDMHLFAVRITPCSHIFHGQCLRKCIIQYGQCPLCKQQL